MMEKKEDVLATEIKVCSYGNIVTLEVHCCSQEESNLWIETLSMLAKEMVKDINKLAKNRSKTEWMRAK